MFRNRRIFETPINEVLWFGQHIAGKLTVASAATASAGFGLEYAMTGSLNDAVWAVGSIVTGLATGLGVGTINRDSIISRNRPCCDMDCNGGDMRLYRNGAKSLSQLVFGEQGKVKLY